MSSALARDNLAQVIEPGPRPAPPIDRGTLEAAAARGAAQREACRRILGQVYRVVAAVLGPRSPDVGDIAQEAFLRVYNHLDRFIYDPDRPGGPTAWVNKIALRTALDHRRASRSQVREDSPSPAGDEAESPLRSALARALLDLLDEQQRAILVLHYWNGETQEEIAETLGIPAGTVKTRMRAAHRRIREYAEQP